MSRKHVYAGGTFDLFHPGHVKLLEAANTYGDVTVALDTDEFSARHKGRRPIMSLKERIVVVRACRFVDEVIVNEGDEDSSMAILRANPDYIIYGDERDGIAYCTHLGITPYFLEEYDIQMVHPGRTSGVSTTEMIERICAATLL